MNRTCVPLPIVPDASRASTSKSSFRPSTAVSVAVASISAPKADGFMCVVFISDPTVVEPSGKNGATAFIAAFSMSATIDGVANTLRPPEPTADAQLSNVTVTLLVCVNPSLSIIQSFLISAKIMIFNLT